MTSLHDADRGHLARALALASHAGVSTSPNPTVGCVVVRDGRRVGEGATAPPGGPHAEVVALRQAGAAARGATAYVTLEPCAHHGRTPPCAQALISAGVGRVVIAHPEVNRLATGGAGRLAAGGVDVVGPLPAEDAFRQAVAAQLEGFLSLAARRRPHVTLKLAQTSDGRLTAPAPHRWVTGPIARRAVHRWRCAVDAVLVGSGTVLADDPRLDVRAVGCGSPPRPVVLDARLRTPTTAAVVRPGAVVVTRHEVSGAARRALEGRGVSVLTVPPGAHGGVALPDALEALGRLGIASILAEPGPTLSRALVAAGLVDRLVLHVALGIGDGPPVRAVPSPPAGPWTTERVGGAGADLVLHLAAGDRADVRGGRSGSACRPAGGEAA